MIKIEIRMLLCKTHTIRCFKIHLMYFFFIQTNIKQSNYSYGIDSNPVKKYLQLISFSYNALYSY